MKRTWHIWIGFVLCLSVVLSALGWVSLAALRLDRAEAEARRQEAQAWRQAAWEERIRLALWRIDSVLAPFVAQESVRPYFAYSPFMPVNRAYVNMFNNRSGGEMLIPSPLLLEDTPNVRVYFQFEPDGQLTSPQMPLGSNRDLAVPQHVSKEAVETTSVQLARVAEIADRDKLLAMLPEHTPQRVEAIISPLRQTPEQRLSQKRQRQSDLANYGRGQVDFNERNNVLQQNATAMVQNQLVNTLNSLFPPPTDVRGVLMTPLWIEGELVLARRITVGGKEYVQGCLLDWPAIETSLLATIQDLLPEAILEPVVTTPNESEAGMLAALPVRLIAGSPIAELCVASGGCGGVVALWSDAFERAAGVVRLGGHP